MKFPKILIAIVITLAALLVIIYTALWFEFRRIGNEMEEVLPPRPVSGLER